MKNISTQKILLLILIFSGLNFRINALPEKLSNQINNYKIASGIIESLYDVKSYFTNLNENEINEVTPQNYLNKSLKRSKQLANEIFCLRTLFSKFSLSGITKAEARKRLNSITEDVIKYRESVYQKIMIEKVCLDFKNWNYISNSMDEIKSNTNTIQENLNKIRLNR